MATVNVVTVVLPLVPVTPTIGTAISRAASSTSESTGVPDWSARRTAGWVSGTPGLGTTTSAARTSVSTSASDGSSRTSIPSSAAPRSRVRAVGASSTTTTRWPRPCSQRAIASPLTPNPITSAFPLI